MRTQLKLKLYKCGDKLYSGNWVGSHIPRLEPKNKILHVCKCEICDEPFLSSNKEDYICYLCHCINWFPNPIVETPKGYKVEGDWDIKWEIINK